MNNFHDKDHFSAVLHLTRSIQGIKDDGVKMWAQGASQFDSLTLYENQIKKTLLALV